MTDEEIVRRYSMLGVVNYIEEQIKAYQDKNNGRKPPVVFVGELEWVAIMECSDIEEWSVAGVPIAPGPDLHYGVRMV